MADNFVDPFDSGSPQAPQPAGGQFNDPFDNPRQRASIPMPDEPDQWSVGNVLRQSLGQGLALGFGDEIEGLVRGVYEAATTGGSYKDAINKGIDYARAQNKAFEEQNPKSDLALQIGGGLLTGVAGGARALSAKGLTMGQKVMRGAGVGGGVGGVTGAGTAEGGVTERALPAASGAVLGATVGAAIPVAAAGGKKVYNAATRMIPGGANRQAKNLLRNIADEDGLTPQTIERRLSGMGDESVIADVGGQNTRDLARYSANKFGGKQAQEMLRDRNVGQGPRIAQAVNKDLSDVPLDDYIEQVGKSRRAMANKDYGHIYDAEIELTPELKKFMENKAVQKAYGAAKDIADADGVDLPPLFQQLDGGVSYLKPNMRTLDYIKQSLDDMVDSSYRGSSPKPKLGNALKNLRDDFRDHLDELVPEYAQVRSTYAGHSASMEAAELGSKFIMTPRSVSANTIKKMGEHERESFLVGVADALKYKVLSAPDGADATKRIFGNHLARERLKAAFGGNEKAYKNFEKTILNEVSMAETNASVNIGSRTTPMAMDEGTFGKAAEYIGDATLAAKGSPIHALSIIGRATESLKAPPEAVAKKLTRLLLSQSPADKQMAMDILKKGPTVGGKYSRFLLAPTTAGGGYLSGR